MCRSASEQISVRAGKIKFPTFLISDYYEVGYAYPWIRPPQEVYSSNPITTLNGVDVLARFRLGDMSLLVQPYYGVSRGAEALVPQEAVTAFPLCFNPNTASFIASRARCCTPTSRPMRCMVSM